MELVMLLTGIRQFLPIYLFIYDLLNDIVNSPDYIA
jgi:hypothetical protein